MAKLELSLAGRTADRDGIARLERIPLPAVPQQNARAGQFQIPTGDRAVRRPSRRGKKWACGLVHSILVTTPFSSSFFVVSKTAAPEWWANIGRAASNGKHNDHPETQFHLEAPPDTDSFTALRPHATGCASQP